MFPIFAFREVTPADHQFWGKIELDLNISLAFYVKNVLLYDVRTLLRILHEKLVTNLSSGNV